MMKNSSARRSVIYILSDEHRGQAASFAGNPNVRTPAIDDLRESGAGFDRSYTNCPVCVPARGTIFSGRHAHSGPVMGFWDNYKIGAPSTATILRSHGYHTCYVGKWHLGYVRNQLPPGVRGNREQFQGCAARTPERHRGGFQDWFAFEAHNQHIDGYLYHQRDVNPKTHDGYITDRQTDIAIDYLSKYDNDEPLFLVLSICPPHFPLTITPRWQRFEPGSLVLRPNASDTSETRSNLANYYAMIENLDWNVGRLVDFVRSRDRFADSLVVYFSDHGEYLGSHGYALGKEHPHEESVRIPTAFAMPGTIPPAGGRNGLFSLVDLLPTTLGLFGIPIPDYCQGTDFSPALRGEEFDPPETVLLEMAGNPHNSMYQKDWRGLVTQEYKYAFYEDGAEILYDLQEDPYETRNVASRRALRNQLNGLLRTMLRETREPYFEVLLDHAVQPDQGDIDVSLL